MVVKNLCMLKVLWLVCQGMQGHLCVTFAASWTTSSTPFPLAEGNSRNCQLLSEKSVVQTSSVFEAPVYQVAALGSTSMPRDLGCSEGH